MKLSKNVEDSAKDVAKHKIAADISIGEPKKKKMAPPEEEYEEEEYEEEEEGGDLESGVRGLLSEWEPTSDEGKGYYEDLAALVDGDD